MGLTEETWVKALKGNPEAGNTQSFLSRPSRMPEKPLAGAQDAKAFAALDSLPAGDRLPLQALFERLQKFGHSDQWALDTARKWYQLHSKLYRG